MQLFHPLFFLWSKNFFYKMLHIFTNQFKIESLEGLDLSIYLNKLWKWYLPCNICLGDICHLARITTGCPRTKFTSRSHFYKEYKEQIKTKIFMSMDMRQHFWEIFKKFHTLFVFFSPTSYSGQFFCSLGERG